jgi:hypothetical protein
MKLFKLEVLGRVGYDEYDSFVVRAKSEEEARELANIEAGFQKDIWLDSDKVLCNEIYLDGDPEIICSSYNAG